MSKSTAGVTAESEQLVEAPDAPEEGIWMGLAENVYSAGIAGVFFAIADATTLPREKNTPFFHKWSRVIIVVSAILLAVSMQVFLVWKVKLLVCAKSVHHIREVYSEYESTMYSKTFLTVNGYHRGEPGFFIPEAFEDFDIALKQEVCQIPLSQPDFLGAVLLMWTISVLYEVRTCMVWAYRFVCVTPTTPSLTIKECGDSEDDKENGLEPGNLALQGLPLWVKSGIVLLFSVQASTELFLGWVGCRWLTATPNFSDIILNGLALTFIMEIKEMLYNDLFPKIFHEETETFRVKKSTQVLKLDAPSLAVPVTLAFGSFAWVVAYMYQFQQVLPQYNWDVKLPCLQYLTELTRV